jgi:hypothetical protein
MVNVAKMHEFLSGFKRYNSSLPIYVEKPFSEDQVAELRAAIDLIKDMPMASHLLPGDKEEFISTKSRLEPRIMTHMSRLIIEFDCPKSVENVMDSYSKPLHKDEISLAHYSYIDYNLKYGDGRYEPVLPPHIDSTENLVTFNYQLGGNVDWDIYIDNQPYSLKTGDAIIFSAVNQVHWRPQREWKEGDFLEIVTFDYCPATDWALTGEEDPIDPLKRPEAHKEYLEGLKDRIEFTSAWDMYNSLAKNISK